mgnify:FL=1
MLRPQFLLTKKIPLTIYRKEAGSYVRGVWVDGPEIEVVVEVNIQPVKPSEVQMMPESDRTREWYKVYSADLLRTKQEGDNGWAADQFEWQGHRYEVMKVQNYAMGTLDHWKAWAARISVTPN